MSSDLVLYRFFDADGGLLYVGKSVNVWQRFVAHRQGSGFFPEAVSVTFQRGFTSEVELLAAESAAIRSEEPRFNVQHKPKPKKRRMKPGPKPGTNRLVRDPNPCGKRHYCGDLDHGPSSTCRDRDVPDVEIANRIDSGESVEAVAAAMGRRAEYVAVTVDRIRRDWDAGGHGCWECPGVSRATVYNARGRAGVES